MNNKRRARLILAHWTMVSLVLCIAESATGQGVFIAAGPVSNGVVGQGYTHLRQKECLVFTPAHVVYDAKNEVPRYPIVVNDGSKTARHVTEQGVKRVSLPDPTLENVAYFTVDNAAPCVPFDEIRDLEGALRQSAKALLRVKEREGRVTDIPVEIEGYDANAIYIRPERERDTIHMGLSGSQLLIEAKRAGMLLSVESDQPGVTGVVARIDALNKVFGFLPNTPLPDSPSNGIILVKTSAKFNWQQVPNATNYDIQYADISSFSEDLTRIPTNNFKKSGLAKRTRYYWRVRAVDASFVGTNFESAWSDIRSFTTGDPVGYRFTQSFFPGWRQWDEKQYFKGIAYPALILAGGLLTHVAHNNHWKFHNRALDSITDIDVERNNERSQDWLMIRQWSFRTTLALYILSLS